MSETTKGSANEAVRDHYLWLVKALMSRMCPEDLSTDTLVSLADLLAPEHARFISSQTGGSGPQLRVVT